MTEPTALDEIASYRARLTDARQKASDTLSLTLRTVGMGLSAITYSFVFSANPNAILAAHRTPLFVASALGALSIGLDVIQSFAEKRAAQSTLDFMKAWTGPGCPTPAELVSHRERAGGDLASGLLVVRAILCLLGVVAVMMAISKIVT